MGHDIDNVQEAIALLRRTWRASAGFFLSIELLLVVLVAFTTVGGVWLAVIGNAACVPAFGLAGGYVAARVMLHTKRILAWPFI